MMWKEVLKEVRMDKDASCCEEARMKIIEWFEEHIGKLPDTSGLKRSLITTSQALSEAKCDELYDDISNFMEMYDLAMSDFFEYQTLRDIVDEWDDCKKEPESVEVKEQNPALSNQSLFDSDPTAWMNQYIRGRN
tara:strand:- start:2 stop:406 length:405 start_codon:yes stop_codon:yes gene_type:complete